MGGAIESHLHTSVRKKIKQHSRDTREHNIHVCTDCHAFYVWLWCEKVNVENLALNKLCMGYICLKISQNFRIISIHYFIILHYLLFLLDLEVFRYQHSRLLTRQQSTVR
jgi:hypothetical protein